MGLFSRFCWRGQAKVSKFALQEFGYTVCFAASRPPQGAFRDRHETRAGRRWPRRRRRDGQAAGRNPREQRHARYDTALTASSFGRDGERTPAVADRDGDVRGRQNRVVLTPGVCASSVAVMRRLNRVGTSAIRKATGAIAHRSPRRARHKPSNHPRREGRLSGVTCSPPRARLVRTRDRGCQPASGLPCALSHKREQ